MTNPVNMVDAIGTVVPRLARNRSAVVRVGKVTAVGTNGFCTVDVVGGSVSANYTRSDKPAVNDVVGLLNDRDIWLILGVLSNGLTDSYFPPTAFVNDTVMSWNSQVTTYSDMGLAVTFTKQRAATKLRVQAGGSYFVPTGSTNGIYVAVRLASTATDYLITFQRNSVVENMHMAYHGIVYLTGVPAGSQTISLRGHAEVAAADGPSLNSNDFGYIDVMELP